MNENLWQMLCLEEIPILVSLTMIECLFIFSSMVKSQNIQNTLKVTMVECSPPAGLPATEVAPPPKLRLQNLAPPPKSSLAPPLRLHLPFSDQNFCSFEKCSFWGQLSTSASSAGYDSIFTQMSFPLKPTLLVADAADKWCTQWQNLLMSRSKV